jgi:hypothetical protein
MRGGATPARGFAVSFLESALVRFDVRAGIRAPDRHSLQLGFGEIIFLALLQLVLDGATLIAMTVQGGRVTVPDSARYAIGAIAAILAAIGVHQAVRVPPLNDIEIAIQGLAPIFDGYTMLQRKPPVRAAMAIS